MPQRLDVQEIIAEFKPERSFLFTYRLDLPHLEHFLLPALQEHGDGEVTLLLDPSGYEATFSTLSAAQGPGVDYLLHPLFLKGDPPVVHPKLYHLERQDRALLIVSSGNLTFSGLGRNAEVLDVFGSSSSPGIFAELGFFYETLLEATWILTSDVKSRIRGAAGRCRNIAEEDRGSKPHPPRLLHTLRDSIFDQVRELVPADAVRSVDIISPFFDPAGEALRRVIRHFGDPPTRVVVNPASSFSPAVAEDLSPPASFEAFSGIGDDWAGGPLHAKIVRFRGDDASWLVAGSPNLSQSGWLRPVSRGGNLEVAVLRTGPAGEFEHLFEPLRTRQIEPTELRALSRPEESDGPLSTLNVIDARLKGDRLVVALLPHKSLENTPTISLEVRVHGQNYRFTDLELQRHDDHLIVAIAPLPEEFDLGDSPADIRLRVRTNAGEEFQGRAWLARPELVAMSADRRSYRRVVRTFSRKGLDADEEDYLGVTRVLEEFLSSLGREAQSREGDDGQMVERDGEKSGTEVTPNHKSERPIDPDRLLIDETDMSPSPRRQSGVSLGLIETVSRTLAQLYLSEDEERRRRAEQRAARGEPVEPSDGSSDPPSSGAHISTSRGRKLHDRLTGTIDEFEEFPLVLARVRHVVAFVSATAQLSLQLFLELQFNNKEDRAHEAEPFLHLLRRLLDLTFSIKGFNFGRPEGWLLRAWAEGDDGQKEVEAALSEEESLPRHFLQLAVLQYFLPDPNARLSMAGLEVLSGERVGGPNVGRLARFAEQIRAVRDRYESFPDEHTLSSELDELGKKELDLVVVARKRAPLILLEGGCGEDPSLLEEVRQLDDPVARRYLRIHDRLDRALLPVDPGDELLYCHECRISLSVRQSKQGLLEGDFPQCEHCGRILVPFDVYSARTRRLLRRMVPELAEAWS